MELNNFETRDLTSPGSGCASFLQQTQPHQSVAVHGLYPNMNTAGIESQPAVATGSQADGATATFSASSSVPSGTDRTDSVTDPVTQPPHLMPFVPSSLGEFPGYSGVYSSGAACTGSLPGTDTALSYCGNPTVVTMPAGTPSAEVLGAPHLYVLGRTDLAPAMAPQAAAVVNAGSIGPTNPVAYDVNTDPAMYEVKKCHLHTKPQLTCKFCRKYKSAVHQQARVARQQEGRWAELQDVEGTAWATVEMTNPTTYNVNNLLRENILASEYFKSLYSLHTFNEIVDEIFNYADHAEPYCAGSSRAPSTLFCCLYKLFTMRLKEHEVQALLDHTDSPYLRCAGFLYLRYVSPPDKLWDWLSPYFLDDETFSAGIDKSRTTTIGEYVESLITEDRYFSTVLPRIPVKIKAQDGAQLITMASHRKRKAQNKARLEQFKPGTPVAACSNGEWLEGRVLSIDGADTGQCSCLVQLDDDVVDLVDLGLVIILDAKIRAQKRREERRSKRVARGLPPLIKKRRARHFKPDDARDSRATQPADASPSSPRASSNRTGSATASDHPSERGASSRAGYSASSGDTRYGNERKRGIEQTSSSFRYDQSRGHRTTDARRSDYRDAGGRDSRRGDDHVSSRYRRGRSSSASRERVSGEDANASAAHAQPKTQSDLMEEFRKRERAKALASGKDYARRPTSYKSSLSLRFETSTGRKRSRSPPVPTVRRDPVVKKPSATSTSRDTLAIGNQDLKKHEPSLAHQQRMAQLVERYSSKGTD